MGRKRQEKVSGKAPVKTGREQRMKEPHRKVVANRPDPESCAGGGNIAGEALTGAHAGQPLSSEIILSACRPCPDKGKATT